MQASIAQHGLHDVPYQGHKEPEWSTEPRHASGLCHQEGEERGNEADGEAYTIDEPGIEVMYLFPECDVGGFFFEKTVGGSFARAAQRDEITLHGVITRGDSAMAIIANHGIF